MNAPARCCGSHHWMGCADGEGSTCCPQCPYAPPPPAEAEDAEVSP